MTLDIATLLAAIGLFLLACQIYLQRIDQRNQAVAQVFDELVTPDFRRKLHFVYSHRPEDLVLSNLSESDRETVEEVTARFDGLGFRVRKGIVPRNEARELFWDLVVRCAQQLRPHLLDQREKRGILREYKTDFDWLARECKLFQLRKLSNKSPAKDLNLDELLKLEPLPIFRNGNPKDNQQA